MEKLETFDSGVTADYYQSEYISYFLQQIADQSNILTKLTCQNTHGIP